MKYQKIPQGDDKQFVHKLTASCNLGGIDMIPKTSLYDGRHREKRDKKRLQNNQECLWSRMKGEYMH